MIPASYQYQLIQLLPKVDQDIDINGVPRISSTALNNEFYSQALQVYCSNIHILSMEDITLRLKQTIYYIPGLVDPAVGRRVHPRDPGQDYARGR